MQYRLALRIECNSTLQAILDFENLHGAVDLGSTNGVVFGTRHIELVGAVHRHSLGILKERVAVGAVGAAAGWVAVLVEYQGLAG